MIPRDNITAWRREAPWVRESQLEQPLIIINALVDRLPAEPIRRQVTLSCLRCMSPHARDDIVKVHHPGQEHV